MHLIFTREKERNLTWSYDENPYTNRKFNNQLTTQKRHCYTLPKHFDYTTIAHRLRTVSWSNNIHPTGVVKPMYGYSTFPLTAKPSNQTDTHL